MKTITQRTLSEVLSLQRLTLGVFILLGVTLYDVTVIKKEVFQLLLKPPVVITIPNGSGPINEGSSTPLIEATCEDGTPSKPVPKDRRRRVV